MKDRGFSGDSLLEHERLYLEKARRTQAASSREGESHPADPTSANCRTAWCGLALSGGGIRSATFNLGLLQGLHRLRLLGIFDYLATVSGGGYIGGFWTAWRYFAGRDFKPGSLDSRLFPSNQPGARGSHLSEVRHLRTFLHQDSSNVMNLRRDLLSLNEAQRSMAVLSAIPTLLAALSFILLVLLLWQMLGGLVLVDWSPGKGQTLAGLALSHALMLLMTFGWLLTSEWLLVRQELLVRRTRDGGRQVPSFKNPLAPELRRFRYSVSATLVATGIVFVLWAWLAQAPSWLGAQDALSQRLLVFLPALTWLGAVAILTKLRWLSSRFMAEGMYQPRGELLDRIIRRLLLLATLWSCFAALWLVGRFLHDFFHARPNLLDTYDKLRTVLAGLAVPLTWLFARAQQFLGRRTAKAHLVRLLAYVTLTLLVLGMILFILETGQGLLHWLTVGVAVFTVLMLLFFDSNRLGLQFLYQDRIARTLIGAAHGEGSGRSDSHPLDDIPLDQLKPGPGPLHLLCCAVNDLAAEDATAYRGAESAVLSSVGFSVGSEGSTWKQLRELGAPVLTLAAAMTASGAAFSSRMGSMRQGAAATFLMAAFNLRLGLWVPHPTRSLGRWARRLFVGLPFYKELLGRSSARHRDVLLSDGGYFDNLGLYELVRRRCRYILVSDCGMDSDTGFDDLANAVRRVREDFGVEIYIDPSPLCAGEEGRARQPLVVGSIEYPDGDTGVLLLLKPTLTGNEPPDITQYKARNASFPNETDGGQVHDEAHWEAYRRLGEHVALTAFRPLWQSTEPLHPSAAQLFHRARGEWLPMPAGYKECLSRFVTRTAELDMLLQRPEVGRLAQEVFRELMELDAQVKPGLRKHGRRRVWSWRHERATGHGPPPSPQELNGALHVLRVALLFMEEVFIAGELATHYGHPAYLGMMNYFARWAYSPLLRAWWPMLKAQYSQRFTQFLEQRFNLPSLDREAVGRLSLSQAGFAMSYWMLQGGRLPRDRGAGYTEQLLSYQLEMPGGSAGTPWFHIQAAQLILRTHHEDGKPLVWAADGGEDRQVMIWQENDLYVPPGLWGIGIGEDFLRMLTSSPELLKTGIFDTTSFSRGCLLAVRFLVEGDASAGQRHRVAEAVQLYRAHGFEEPEPALRQWLASLESELDQAPALRGNRRGDEHWLSFWLVRTYWPPELSQEDERAHPGAQEEPALH